MKRRTVRLGAALVLVCTGVLAAHGGSAGDIRGTLANGWQRYAIGSKGAQTQVNAVYAGDSGFLAIGFQGWASRDGKRWTPVPGLLSNYALSQHIPNLNLVRVGMSGAVKGTTYSVKREGPNGGYIAVGSYTPPGQPVTKTRAEVAISRDSRSWHTVSGKGKTFIDAAMTDVARAGSGWVAGGFNWGPLNQPLVWTSTDAIHWQRIANLPTVAPYGEIESVLHGPTGFLAVANGLDGPAETWTSRDGLHWQAAPVNSFEGGILQQVTVGGPGYLAVGT